MYTVHNPIISGFNPDPSICRVGEDYYVATSTFEWFPGVQIHHSKDLKNWNLVRRPLERTSQLDLKGCPHSGGVWAPCLSYEQGVFYLICSNVRSHGGPVTDSPIHLFTSDSIEGEWSEPIYLGANGFDPSLFHDKNGKKYLVNMEMGAVNSTKRFNGITLQEYCPKTKKLIGEAKSIWSGTELGITEGPHIYQKDDWYYLICAEGGTGTNHAVSVARSRSIWGPYETDPANPMLTSANKAQVNLQAAGHADLFQTPNGDWYMVHLCKRFLPGTEIAPLGRETALQKVIWEKDQFPRLSSGGNTAQDSVEIKSLTESTEETVHDGSFHTLDKNMHFLRELPNESWMKLEDGKLKLKGRNSLFSLFDQSLVARRLQHFYAEAETCISFDPKTAKQEAGLIAYIDGRNHHYFRISNSGSGVRELSVISCNNATGWGDTVPKVTFVSNLGEDQPVYLKMRNELDKLYFFWSLDGKKWKKVAKTFDTANMGDGASQVSPFTGTFWGICCQDMTGDQLWAEFNYFKYTPLQHHSINKTQKVALQATHQ